MIDFLRVFKKYRISLSRININFDLDRETQCMCKSIYFNYHLNCHDCSIQLFHCLWIFSLIQIYIYVTPAVNMLTKLSFNILVNKKTVRHIPTKIF